MAALSSRTMAGGRGLALSDMGAKRPWRFSACFAFIKLCRFILADHSVAGVLEAKGGDGDCASTGLCAGWMCSR